MTIRDFSIPEPSETACLPGAAVVMQADARRDHYVVETGRSIRQATRTPSCLVQPQIGDMVACLEGREGVAYITAVLERSSDAPLTLKLPPGAVIQCEDGSLELRADALALRARAINVEGEQAHLNVEQVAGVGRRASWSFSTVKFTAELVESFAERLLQFSRWSQRLVDGPDQVRARMVDYRAEQTMQLQAQTMIANAEKLFKADSDQIHLG